MHLLLMLLANTLSLLLEAILGIPIPRKIQTMKRKRHLYF
jgi:uncharacterized protein YneF (UPF0154 family)